MMYIKSLTSGNGNNFELFEAQKIKVKERWIPLNWNEISKEDDTFFDFIDATSHIIFRMNMHTTYDQGHMTEFFRKTRHEKKKETEQNANEKGYWYNEITYTDPETGERCLFIPCGQTYIVNDKGATVSTIGKIKAYNN